MRARHHIQNWIAELAREGFAAATIQRSDGHLYEPLDEIAADVLEQLIADAIAHGTRTDRGLEL